MDVLVCNFGQKVRSWLTCVPVDVRVDPERLLNQLKEEYGEKRQPLQLLQLVLLMRHCLASQLSPTAIVSRELGTPSLTANTNYVNPLMLNRRLGITS